jgi:hypothetical protein
MTKYQVIESATGYTMSHPLHGMSSTLFDTATDAYDFMVKNNLRGTHVVVEVKVK